MNLTKVVSIASLCAVFAVGAAAQGTTSTTPSTKTSSKAATKTTTAKTKAASTSAGDKVAPADLPQPVTEAVMKAHPKGTISSAMKMTKGSAVSYSVSGKDGAKSFKMTLNADGTAPTTAKKASTKTSSKAAK